MYKIVLVTLAFAAFSAKAQAQQVPDPVLTHQGILHNRVPRLLLRVGRSDRLMPRAWIITIEVVYWASFGERPDAAGLSGRSVV